MGLDLDTVKAGHWLPLHLKQITSVPVIFMSSVLKMPEIGSVDLGLINFVRQTLLVDQHAPAKQESDPLSGE